MENLDYDSQQRRELFALYGLAMYHAQCFEKSLVIIESVAYNRNYFKSDIEVRDRIFRDSFKRTAGQLVLRLKDRLKISDDLEKSIVEAIKKRNWLAHDYFWENAIPVLSTEGREKLIKELHDISDYFSEMDERMVNIYQKVFNKIGLTEEEARKHMENMIKK